MNLVNTFMVLESEQNIVWPSRICSRMRNEHRRVTFDMQGYGNFFWGTGLSDLEGYAIPLLILDEQTIICFTSTPTNVLKLAELVSETIGIKLSIARPTNINMLLDDHDIVYYKTDPAVGIRFILKTATFPGSTIVNIYRNGVTTFTMTSDDDILKRILKLNLKLLRN